MKTFKTMVVFLLLASIGQLSYARKTDAALEVMQRASRKTYLPIKLAIKRDKGKNYFSYSVNNGILRIEGSDNIALCRGFYDYVKSNKYGLYAWSGNNISLPQNLPEKEKKETISPFANHYYFNVVTYGYSMPYWDWKRWEKEIDWMALHGINMPLALVANEAISARVWSKLGLTQKEIDNYFVGPAHLPWMRMGNISGIDGPISTDWHQQQIALQHKILKRMRDLGMKPICPAFAGFIPQAIKRIYPYVKITETSWAGSFHNWMLSPEEDLFHTIGKMFIEEWEKEFGKNEYYIADSFNEMDIPFPPQNDLKRYSLLTSYGERVYQSIKEGNKDAIWVMQGWMFGYQRNIWDYKTLAALVDKVPDEKMLILDLAVDYNKHFWHTEVNWEFYKGFFNKPWVYSVIPNMGGKSGMTGVLEFYANGHLEALNSANKGRLSAFGIAPEGIENNEVIYELLSDAGWSDRKIDLRQWLKDYSTCRYGSYPEPIKKFWDKMLVSVYGTFTDHPRYNWQIRPGIQTKGSINTSTEFHEGMEQLMTTSEVMKSSELFTYDLIQWTAAYTGSKLEVLIQQIERSYTAENYKQASILEKEFESMMLDMDALLSAYPSTSLQTWIDRARAYGLTKKQADTYESNARRIVTIWGPPVDDYSARIWGGLIRDYYLPRWKAYFEQKRTGKKFDFAQWESHWVEKETGLSTVKIPEDLFDAAISLLQRAAKIKEETGNLKEVVAHWQNSSFTKVGKWETLTWNISTKTLMNLKGLRFNSKKGTVAISEVSIWADGEKVKDSKGEKIVSSSILIDLNCKERISGNNSLELKVNMKTLKKEDVEGYVETVY